MNATTNVQPERRKFLQTMGAGAMLLATANWPSEIMGELTGESVEGSEGDTTANTWAILIDTTRCSGCQSCALACKTLNKLPNPDQPPTHLASDAYTFIDNRSTGVEASDGASREAGVTYIKRQCMHCLHPACASACTVGALRKTASGPVVYDAAKCIGCRYCQYACPFGVPTYAWDEPLGLISKCEMCFKRLNTGQLPACIAACPNGALRLGKRGELLAQAHAQIASNRGRYVDTVYGEHEAGGTAMLYLAAVPFEQLGLPTLESEVAPEKAEVVMKNTPTVALSVAALATGLYWLTHRRFQAALRPALLVGLLGYSAVLVLLVLDLGRPDRFYHFLLFWNLHSPLFEISWCVLLYTTVLVIEIFPDLCQRLGWARLQGWAKAIMAPVTIIGVTLSTLHQSTLGTLYLNMPYRLDPRWYTPLLPLLFYVSSIVAGLSMAAIAYRLATRIHHAREDRAIIRGLGVGAACVALFYGGLRFFALWSDGALPMLLVDTLLNRLLALELALGVFVPAALMLIPALRRQSWVQWTAPLLMLGGVGLNRFDATLFAQHGAQQVAPYVPHIMEWLSTIGILAGAALVWYACVSYLVSLRSR